MNTTTTPSEDEVRRLLAEAVGGLEPSDNALDTIRAGYVARQRVNRRRRWIAAGTTTLAVAATVAVVLGMTTTTSPRPQRLRVAAPDVDPAKALEAYAAGIPNVVVRSAPVAIGHDQVAVLAIAPETGNDVVRVVSFVSGEWQKVVDLQQPLHSFDGITDPVLAADVTSDGRADFLVRVTGGDNTPGVVVSDASGTWRLVPMSPDPTDVLAARDPAFRNGELVTQFNACLPNCAAGHVSDVTWTYSTGAGHFTPVDDRQAIKMQVQGFYNAYNGINVAQGARDLASYPNPAPNDGSPTATDFAKASPDLTGKLKAALDAWLSGSLIDHDLFTCIQNTFPDPYLADASSISGGTATVVVHQTVLEGADSDPAGKRMVTTNIKVTLRKSGVLWQLDAVDCL